MTERSLRELARSVVGQVAPAELPDFDFVAAAFADNPQAARRSNQSRNETTASGFAVAGEVLGSLVLAVGVDLCKDAVVGGIRAAGRETRQRWSLLRSRRVDLDESLPPVAEADIEQLESLAVRAAQDRGATDDMASRVGSALARLWPRLP